MKQILFNLALIELNKFCVANAIDCAGSHLEKRRGFQYNLMSDATGEVLAAVTFHKSQVPTFMKASQP